MMMSMMMGMGGETDSAYLEGVIRGGTALSPATALAQIRLNTNGNCESAPTNGVFVTEFVWLTGINPPSGYECRATLTSGTFTGGIAGSWLSLGSTQTWSRNRSDDAVGTTSCTFTLEIRSASTLTILASASMTMNATVNSPA